MLARDLVQAWNKQGVVHKVTVLDDLNHAPLSGPHLFLQPIQALEQLTVPESSILYTCWESTVIPERYVEQLNRFRLILVPSGFCATVLSANKVTVPVLILPLGCDTPSFPNSVFPNGGFTIGAAASKIGWGGVRKHPQLIIDAFKIAFRGEPSVRLKIKLGENETCDTNDSRITVEAGFWKRERLESWYRSLHVFASSSGAEGWGLHQQEAMCCGRPVLSVNFGGVTEFWNPTNGFDVAYQLTEAQGVFDGCGQYARPEIGSLASAMRLAFEDRSLIEEKADLSAYSAAQFPLWLMARNLAALLREIG